MPKPEIFVANSATKFDADGRLTDEATGKSVAGHNIASTAAFNALLSAKGIAQQDFVGEVF